MFRGYKERNFPYEYEEGDFSLQEKDEELFSFP